MFKLKTYRGKDKYAIDHVESLDDEIDTDKTEEEDQNNRNLIKEVEELSETEEQSGTTNSSSYYYYDDTTVGNSTIATTLSTLKRIVSMNVSPSTDKSEVAAASVSNTGVGTPKSSEKQQHQQLSSDPEEITLRRLIQPGNTAVVTGASSGIGRAACFHFAKNGMNVFMVDNDAQELAVAQKLCKELVARPKDDSHVASSPPQYILAEVIDVTDSAAMEALAKQVYNTMEGKCHILMNNAGIGLGGNSLTDMATVERVMAVNTYGSIHGCTAFIPRMIKQHPEPGIVINTGSKQGITMPPGNLTYNMSKAALKVYTEGLEYELMLQRKAGLCSIRAALLLPGWVNTSILLKSEREKAKGDGVHFNKDQTFFHEEKPATGAWMPSQVIDYMTSELDNPEKFYIVCPDNDVDRQTDNLRMIWTSQDIIQDRPPLSRWHPDYKIQFQEFLVQNSKKQEK
jgi:NAD(P)-dependent dehydrogenase (short-subunit alcohol dehydrogenase family)